MVYKGKVAVVEGDDGCGEAARGSAAGGASLRRRQQQMWGWVTFRRKRSRPTGGDTNSASRRQTWNRMVRLADMRQLYAIARPDRRNYLQQNQWQGKVVKRFVKMQRLRDSGDFVRSKAFALFPEMKKDSEVFAMLFDSFDAYSGTDEALSKLCFALYVLLTQDLEVVPEKELHAGFSVFDYNHSGKLDRSEFVHLMEAWVVSSQFRLRRALTAESCDRQALAFRMRDSSLRSLILLVDEILRFRENPKFEQLENIIRTFLQPGSRHFVSEMAVPRGHRERVLEAKERVLATGVAVGTQTFSDVLDSILVTLQRQLVRDFQAKNSLMDQHAKWSGIFDSLVPHRAGSISLKQFMAFAVEHGHVHTAERARKEVLEALTGVCLDSSGNGSSDGTRVVQRRDGGSMRQGSSSTEDYFSPRRPPHLHPFAAVKADHSASGSRRLGSPSRDVGDLPVGRGQLMVKRYTHISLSAGTGSSLGTENLGP